MSQHFFISTVNPNDETGGCGCLCGDGRQQDAHGPYVVFPGSDNLSSVSPHVVLCYGCACAASDKLTAPAVDESRPAL